MKTDQLIALLADDLEPARRGMVLRWLLLGLARRRAAVGAGDDDVLKPRPDLDAAMAGGAFWMKIHLHGWRWRCWGW